MNTNEIKKTLYREKIHAHIIQVSKQGVQYRATLKREDDGDLQLWFLVPLSDMGDGIFSTGMPAKLLIRYLVDPVNV